MELTVPGAVLDTGKVVGIAALRAFGGWLKNALADGKVTGIEVKKLGATLVEISLIAGCLHWGIEGIFGTDVSVLGAAAGAFVVDKILHAWKKK